jgi:hypothetical protein
MRTRIFEGETPISASVTKFVPSLFAHRHSDADRRRLHPQLETLGAGQAKTHDQHDRLEFLDDTVGAAVRAPQAGGGRFNDKHEQATRGESPPEYQRGRAVKRGHCGFISCS